MDVFSALNDVIRTGKPVVLCLITKTTGSTPRHAGSKMLVFEDGSIVGTVGGGETEARVIKEAKTLITTTASKTLTYSLVSPDQGDPGLCGGTIEIYLESIQPKERLVIIGAGHVGLALNELGKWMGYHTILVDDRKEIMNSLSENIANEIFCIPPKLITQTISFTERDFIVLTTRGTDFDIICLPDLISLPVEYIGIIGSKRRWQHTKSILIEQGISEKALKKVYSPIGLNLQAETPKEIALSIFSEILMVKNKTNPSNMRIQQEV